MIYVSRSRGGVVAAAQQDIMSVATLKERVIEKIQAINVASKSNLKYVQKVTELLGTKHIQFEPLYFYSDC